MKTNNKLELYWITFIIIGKIVLRLEQFPIIYSSITVFAFLTLLMIYIKNIKSFVKVFLSPFVISLFIIFGYLTLRTISMGFPIQIYLLMIVFMPIAFLFAYKNVILKSPEVFFVIVADVYLTYFTINTILMIFLPNLFGSSSDGYSYLIASNYNQMGGIVIPGLLASAGAMYYKSKYKKRFIMMSLLTIFMVLYAGSMTSTICLTLILLYYIFAKKYRLISKIAFGGMIAIIAFFIIDVVISSFTNSISFNGFIERFLTFIGKDATFSGRTNVWLKSFLIFSNEPLEGIGYYDREWSEIYLGVANTHNIIIEILLQGGFVWLLMIVIAIFILIKNVIKIDSIESRLSLFIILVCLFMMQLEVYRYFHLVMSFLILYMMIYTHKYSKR